MLEDDPMDYDEQGKLMAEYLHTRSRVHHLQSERSPLTSAQALLHKIIGSCGCWKTGTLRFPARISFEQSFFARRDNQFQFRDREERDEKNGS